MEDCQQEVAARRGISICFYLFFDKRGYRLVALVGISTLDVCILDIQQYENCALVPAVDRTSHVGYLQRKT